MSENFLNDNRFDASDTKITCVSSVTSVVNNDEDNWDDIVSRTSANRLTFLINGFLSF